MKNGALPNSLFAICAAALALALGACGAKSPQVEAAAEPSQVSTVVEAAAETPVRNVILIIGDGMGPQQIGLLEQFARRASLSPYGDDETALSRIARESTVALSLTGPADALVVDSACSASQLASGVASPGEALGVDVDGNPVPSVLEVARAHGWATGLVSDTRMTHATPAAFAAHLPHRSFENEVAVAMIEAGIDVLMSGGLRYFTPSSVGADEEAAEAYAASFGIPYIPQSRRDDERDLLNEARASGYELAFDAGQLDEAVASDRVIGLFANSSMMNGIVESEFLANPNPTLQGARQPTLEEMATGALEVLSRDAEGFFLMIEAGQIDWAGHNNDAGHLLHELLRMDRMLDGVFEWARDRDDTLIVVTADHETGGFGFSYHRADVPEAQTIPGGVFENTPYQPNFNFGPVDVLDGIYQQRATYGDLIYGFADLPEQTPAALVDLVNSQTQFPIDAEDAIAILSREENHYHVEGHPYLSARDWPEFHDFEAFYVYGNGTATGLLARAVAEQQSVVWGTGTHTATPVPVIAWGPESARSKFAGIMHHTEVGAALIEAVSR